MGEEPAVTDPIANELRLIRSNVPGVRGSVTATTDGLLLAHDVHGLEPTQIAALVAATHAVAVRASLSTECGQLKEVITRGSEGYLAVYAAGGNAIVAILGTTDLNVAMLNFQARRMIERVAEHSAGLARRPRAHAPGTTGARGQDVDRREGGEPLPARRSPGE
jgi:predicted regulator of Ras-like GTPase activity (Roadblock/LC7/MglB family)